MFILLVRIGLGLKMNYILPSKKDLLRAVVSVLRRKSL